MSEPAATPKPPDSLRGVLALLMRLLRPGVWTTVSVRIEDGKIRLVQQTQSWTPDKLPTA